MSPSHKARAVLACIALLSLGLKAAAIQGAPAPTDAAARESLSAFLDSQGFFPEDVPPMAGIGMVGGRRGDCRVILAGMSLQGWQDDILGQIRAPGDTVRFVFDGAESPEPPKWRARLAYYGDKVRRGMSMAPSGSKLTGVVASPGCDSVRIDWSRLGPA